MGNVSNFGLSVPRAGIGFNRPRVDPRQSGAVGQLDVQPRGFQDTSSDGPRSLGRGFLPPQQVLSGINPLIKQIPFQSPNFDPRLLGGPVRGGAVGQLDVQPRGFQDTSPDGIGSLQRGFNQSRSVSGNTPPIKRAAGENTPPFDPNGPVQMTQFQPQPPQAQFGLSGAESALRQGLVGAGQAARSGTRSALGTLLNGFNESKNFINQGVAALGGNPNRFSSGGAGARAGTATAGQVDQRTGQQFFQDAAGGVGAFSGAGLSAQQQQAALSGALGSQAQSDAIQAFNGSPGQQFLRDQGQEAIINQASALGGLGGGNVRKELARFGTGLAQQDFQNQFNRLGQLSAQGLQAAGQRGQFLSQAGQQEGNLANANAQLVTQASINNANNATRSGINNANIAAQLAGQQSRLFGQGANIASSLAGQGAGFQFGSGNNLAGLINGTGNRIAGARIDAGNRIANNISQTTSGLSNLVNNQGRGLADIIGAGSSNLANLLAASGQTGNQSALAQLLSNLNVGAATNISNIGIAQSRFNAAAALRQGENRSQLIGNLTGLISDSLENNDNNGGG